MFRFWDVLLVFFILFMKINPVEAQRECVTYPECSSCLSHFGCVFVWGYSGKGMCIDELNEDEFDILKMARLSADCPSTTVVADNPSDFGLNGLDAERVGSEAKEENSRDSFPTPSITTVSTPLVPSTIGIEYATPSLVPRVVEEVLGRPEEMFHNSGVEEIGEIVTRVIAELALPDYESSLAFICPADYKETGDVRMARSLCRSYTMINRLSRRNPMPDSVLSWNKMNPFSGHAKLCEHLVWLRINCIKK